MYGVQTKGSVFIKKKNVEPLFYLSSVDILFSALIVKECYVILANLIWHNISTFLCEWKIYRPIVFFLPHSNK